MGIFEILNLLILAAVLVEKVQLIIHRQQDQQ